MGDDEKISEAEAAEVPQPQSKVTTPDESSSDRRKTEEKTSGINKQKEDNDDVAALAKGLGSVSIAPKPDLKEPIAPEEIRNVASLLASNKYKNIVVLTGAGVSCNAGIPDFRTPGTGLYDNLQKYNLPFPEAVFDLGYYRRNPSAFVQLASELWPGKHSPTITHSFIALLEKKEMLLRVYTQNIDMLDVLAGVSEEKMIECHGHFRTASCINCNRSYDGKECKRIIVEEVRAPECQHCRGYVKPDIVFFGESLPTLYHRMVRKDMKKADLLIVMGTSLMVGPVNQIPDIVRRDCPRVLFNNELVGSFRRKNGPNTRRKSYDTSAKRDIFHEGDCDRSVRMLCTLLGWEHELDELNRSHHLG
eukprot:CAMPEP_0172537156 /NCGR_PEP_ID=MMETSP1067-20121228/8821_1 /TAXON_ID=265564 ORGANISM="Thalassiosira punctigera, Strain Tpunct2005C2" /NCGR_SAMPLE_ID=MMETSP1067 /ASSEMBLY_ACC=CAM_ASM_000444 /LENGTH=361 /DNA_ID=CAMNT_0013322399 /DNA_START=145 /DNA_END=1230 /DNA_ORIENTATION=+